MTCCSHWDEWAVAHLHIIQAFYMAQIQLDKEGKQGAVASQHAQEWGPGNAKPMGNPAIINQY